MKKAILSLLFFLPTYLMAQQHLGFHSDNYAGIYNVHFQPADIVDSRYAFDMNLAHFDFSFYNNYIGIRRSALFQDRSTAFDDPDFQDNYLVERLNGRDKGTRLGIETMLPLSFMFNFRKKNALAFSTRVRVFQNLDGVNESLARQIYNELDLTDIYNIRIDNQNFSLQAGAWAEAGFTYGREIFDLGNHYLKGAVGFRMTQGIASAYLYSDNLDVSFSSDSTISVIDSDLDYGFSSNLFIEGNDVDFDFLPGFAGDVGLVYEWRPNIEDHYYEMDGDSTFLDPRRNKYKLKLGLSVTDIGAVRFRRAESANGIPYSNRFYADNRDMLVDHFGNAFNEFELETLHDTLTSKFTELGSDGDIYRMRLPLRLNLTADYNIWKGFYVNGTFVIAPRFRRSSNKSSALSSFAITPRFEHKWFGVHLPLSMDAFRNIRFGTGLRMGPLVIGTTDITPLVGRKEIYGADVYAMFRIPIGKKIRDKDKDHVSNKMDECKKEPGPWATKGCPDLDGDGITNDIDQCPDVPGIEAFNGCPDTDGDGLQDSEDDCPEVAGDLELGGCPDTDGDGLIDKVDSCVNTPGPAEFNGCPDSDEDGIIDSEDSCPNDKGLKKFNGCPDSDADGLPDNEDDCPMEAGPADNKGCPYNDNDNDGVINEEDECPNTAGTVENNGCPEVTEEEQEVIDIAFANLEFESGKDKIKPRSYESLNNLAKLMQEREDIRLRIEGHTDAVGSEAANLQLSKDRAFAVRDFLMEYNLGADRFDVDYYGETQPIDTNDTPEGRARNRRVEMEIIFN